LDKYFSKSDIFTVHIIIFFESNWKMNIDNKLPLCSSNKEKQGRKFCSSIFRTTLLSWRSQGFMMRLPPAYSIEVLRREMFIKESLNWFHCRSQINQPCLIIQLAPTSSFFALRMVNCFALQLPNAKYSQSSHCSLFR
jgi:hypothetical protein